MILQVSLPGLSVRQLENPQITNLDDDVAWKLHCDGFGSGVAPTVKKDSADTNDINTILLSLKKIAAETESGSSKDGSTSNSTAIANGPPKAAGK